MTNEYLVSDPLRWRTKHSEQQSVSPVAPTKKRSAKSCLIHENNICAMEGLHNSARASDFIENNACQFPWAWVDKAFRSLRSSGCNTSQHDSLNFDVIASCADLCSE